MHGIEDSFGGTQPTDISSNAMEQLPVYITLCSETRMSGLGTLIDLF
jgi:hypothetical protein